MESPPIEVTVRLHGWRPGESQVLLSIPESSELGRLLATVPVTAQGPIFARLRDRLLAELSDAFSALEAEPERAASRL